MATVPSCMSLFRLGTTNATVGSCVKSEGKSVKGRLTVAGSWLAPGAAACQSLQGLCLRTYVPELVTNEPTEGRSSLKPVNVRPEASRAAPRLGVAKGAVGGVSS